MADFIATKEVKGKIIKQRFTDHSWDLLGPNKNGWLKPGEQVVGSITDIQKPSTGQRIENTLKNESSDTQKIDDVNKSKTNQVIEDKLTKRQEEFLKHIEGFNKGIIKDFFDKENEEGEEKENFVKIEYSNKASLGDLKKQLGEYLKYDVKILQEKFEA